MLCIMILSAICSGENSENHSCLDCRAGESNESAHGHTSRTCSYCLGSVACYNN